MKLAICAPFMESDLWQERLRRACLLYTSDAADE